MQQSESRHLHLHRRKKSHFTADDFGPERIPDPEKNGTVNWRRNQQENHMLTFCWMRCHFNLGSKNRDHTSLTVVTEGLLSNRHGLSGFPTFHTSKSPDLQIYLISTLVFPAFLPSPVCTSSFSWESTPRMMAHNFWPLDFFFKTQVFQKVIFQW